MKDQFVPYELAVKLKELGFDEHCFAGYNNPKILLIYYKNECFFGYENIEEYNGWEVLEDIKAPLWQQAFAFLLRKLKGRELYAALEFDGEVTLWEVVTEDSYKTYNKILASGNKESLEKLIELCKNN